MSRRQSDGRIVPMKAGNAAGGKPKRGLPRKGQVYSTTQCWQKQKAPVQLTIPAFLLLHYFVKFSFRSLSMVN